MNTFDNMGLSDDILEVLKKIGFETPSEIQSKAIPYLLNEYGDFIGLAQTGTGKTAAFGLPIIDRIDIDNRKTQALILSPTRELCQQIAEQMTLFSQNQKKINILAVYGGSSITKQMNALKRDTQHIIIATPGRLIDLLKRKYVDLSGLHVAVLDEADEMLNMGFKEDIDEILTHTPEEKMTWLFSATMADNIKRIVKKFMDDPFEVRIKSEDKVNVNIEHLYTTVKNSNKDEALKRFIDINSEMRAVVFCRTKRDTQNLAEDLLKQSYKVDALHGDLSQEMRDRVMRRFKNEEIDILIATDVAARGIDVNDLTHVIHYSLPDDDAYYTHRSGRTARAGKKGISLVFIGGRERYKVERLQKQLSISFQHIKIPDVGEIAQVRVKNWCQDVLNYKNLSESEEHFIEVTKEHFKDISKDELVSKLLSHELSKLKTNSNYDLNDKASDRQGGDREGRRDGRGGGGGGGGNRRRSDRRRSDSRDRDRPKSKKRRSTDRPKSDSSGDKSKSGKSKSKRYGTDKKRNKSKS